MIDVGEVYGIVRDLCNKDQKGFVTPAVFNNLAVLAQQKVFNEMFAKLVQAKAARRSGMDPGRENSVHTKLEEDLQYYVKQVLLNQSDFDAYEGQDEDGNAITVNPDGAFTSLKVLDLHKVISINVSDTGANIEVVTNAEKANRILRSNLSTPTDDFPVALMFGNKFQVFPDTVTSVQLNYYRTPSSVYPIAQGDFLAGDFDYTSQPRYASIEIDPVSGFVVQDPLNSRNFDLPPNSKSELILEITKLIGVRLRDQYLYQATGLIEKES
jgi:hypothetical protein